MEKIKDIYFLRDSFRSKTYIISVVLMGFLLGFAALLNWQKQYAVVSALELAVVFVLLTTIPFALKKKHLELLGNGFVYLVAVLMILVAINIPEGDPGPYLGFISLPIGAVLLVTRPTNYYVFTVVLYVGIFVISTLGLTSISGLELIKFHVIYIFMSLLLAIHKSYLVSQEKELLSLTERAYKKEEIAEKRAEESATAAKTYKVEKEETEGKNKELEARTNELEILNEAMVGRELKMIELKKRVNQLLAELGRPPENENV